MRTLLLILFLIGFRALALDTLCTHPKYPPITYRNGEYRFYKYTAKYIPESMLHCFKILATCGDQQLCTFMKRTEEEVVKDGMYQKGFRMRKEFCLDGYSSFVGFFHRRGIYYPYAMKTYILLCFHQYLNKEKIRWHYNKRLALDERKELNKAWKDRLDHVFEPIILDAEPADIVDPVFLDPIEKEFYTY
ncbi:MAG: hypothetical protein HUJ25_09805 [Crocinitomicaceae bacterium]|nr:hypothetical protein [Crocinitomicaceae bacterium]